MERLPIFPLGLVLLPRMPLPLHIFEPRYREMIARCIDESIAFGVVLHTGSTIQHTGCLARIDSVINRYDDGRLDILTVGTDRFRVHRIHEVKAYLEADIERFGDREPSGDEQQTLPALATQAMESLSRFAISSGYEVDGDLVADLTFEELSFLLATTDVFSLEERQRLLEGRSTADRIRTAADAILESSKRREMTTRIREVLGKREDEDITHLFN